MSRNTNEARAQSGSGHAPQPRGEDAQPLYTLAVASQLLGLAPRTIRAYEEAGLIEPSRSGQNRQRLYSRQDLRWLRCIYEMVHIEGYTLRAIRRLLDFAPCWEIRQCSKDVAARCASGLRIPPSGRCSPRSKVEAAEKTSVLDAVGKETAQPVQIKIIWGVQEFGAVMHCTRCTNAERIARKVAEEFRPHVTVTTHDILSAEARRYGVLMTPTIVINDEVVSVGKGLSQQRLRELICQHIAAQRKRTAEGRTGKTQE
ncbi:MAG: MerR family transcriptional regulator [Armatimonadetes bacterium]|nr:MerR family transcriptional regulator [Armatimonadota bacterium]